MDLHIGIIVIDFQFQIPVTLQRIEYRTGQAFRFRIGICVAIDLDEIAGSIINLGNGADFAAADDLVIDIGICF